MLLNLDFVQFRNTRGLRKKVKNKAKANSIVNASRVAESEPYEMEYPSTGAG